MSPETVERLSRLLTTRLPGARVHVVHDARPVLATGGVAYGIALIAGTGSVAWGVTPGASRPAPAAGATCSATRAAAGGWPARPSGTRWAATTAASPSIL
jgi:hypothetical protein